MKHALCPLAAVPTSGTIRVDFFGREAPSIAADYQIKAALSSI